MNKYYIAYLKFKDNSVSYRLVRARNKSLAHQKVKKQIPQAIEIGITSVIK